MLKKCLFSAFCVIFLLMTFPVLTSAASVVDAPGGMVTSYDELVDALGGPDAAIMDDGALLIVSDICLKAPVIITEGSYEIRGAGVEITASFTDSAFFVIGGDEKVSVIFGRSANDSTDVDLTLNGEGKTREGSLIFILEKSEAAMYKGTHLTNNITTVMGGAVYSCGGFVIYGGTIDHCRSIGSGGAIASRGELILPSGTISDCSAEFGGAVYNEGKAGLAGTEIKDCSAQKGGAVFNTGNLQLVSSTVTACTAEQGGCLYNSGESALNGGQILSCKAENGGGGGMYNTGSATLNGTFFQYNEASNGGSIFNVGSFVAEEGILQDGTVSEFGGHIYNDTTGSYTYKGGAISRGKAKYGGGVFNLGTFRCENGSFSLNKADVGQAILNEGNLIFCQFPYVDPKNDVAILLSNDNAHAIDIQTQMKAELIAQLTPYQRTEDGYTTAYEEGIVLIKGEFAATSASRFDITPVDGVAWMLSDDGTLTLPIPVYQKPWFYITILVAFAATVAAFVFVIRFFDKKKLTQNLAK